MAASKHVGECLRDGAHVLWLAQSQLRRPAYCLRRRDVRAQYINERFDECF